METSPVQSIQTLPPSVSYYKTIDYKNESAKMNFTSKEGDSVEISYSKTELAMVSTTSPAAGNKPLILSPEEADKLRASLNQELLDYKQQIIQAFIKSQGGAPAPEEDPEVAALEAKMPEYWNADNTSQRIVDFATSFLSSFSGENEEFFKTIKGAIEEGFKQAKDMLGNLPGPVGKLIQKTYDLTMQKLDKYEQDVAAQNAQQNTQQSIDIAA